MPTLEIVTIFKMSGQVIRLEGYFKVSYDGQWVVIQKLTPARDTVIATLIYNNPDTVVWREKDETDSPQRPPV